MNIAKSSRNWLSLALCLGLSTTGFMAHAHEASAPTASGPEAGQTDGGKTPEMQHHYHHEDGYQGHHGNGAYPKHHGMSGQGGMHHNMPGYGAVAGGPAVDLGLDEEQLEEIAKIQKELRSELQEPKVERYEASLKLEELYTAEELDAGDINDQQQRVFDVIKEITELQVEAQQDIRDVLNTEQRNQLMRSGDWLMLN